MSLDEPLTSFEGSISRRAKQNDLQIETSEFCYFSFGNDCDENLVS